MSKALFQIALDASLLLCALGLLWRMSAWYRVRIGPDAQTVKLAQRVRALLRGIAAALFSRRVFHVLAAFFLDVLLQRRLYRSDKSRWLAHLFIFSGFMLLLLMHALASVVTVRLFPGYESTQNPYLFLRNLFGAMVVVGLAHFLFGLWRRRSRMAPVRRPMAWSFIALLATVVVSGFLLEADKIASPEAFYNMARQNGVTDPAELEPLRAFWASEFGVAIDDLKLPIAPEVMRKGRQMHDENCAQCHASAASAFVSYPVARALAPLARLLDQGHAPAWLHYLHLFACFVGLATLPLTRFFHAVASPFSLLVNGAAPSGDYSVSRSDLTRSGRASRRALALDACVQCGICDAHCSVAPLARHLGNRYLLPSHKLIATGAMASGRLLLSGDKADGARDNALRVAEGAFLCTDCARCTRECPVGLNLEDLWQAGRGDLAAAGLPAPAQWVQASPALAWAESLQPDSLAHGFLAADAASAPLCAERSSFSSCVQCQACTNVCPVVAHSTDPAYSVDLTPQNVLNLLRLGLRDLTLGSRMVWDCAGCYQCQEHCPQGIRVADIMLELRALAVQRLGTVRYRRTPS